MAIAPVLYVQYMSLHFDYCKSCMAYKLQHPGITYHGAEQTFNIDLWEHFETIKKKSRPKQSPKIAKV